VHRRHENSLGNKEFGIAGSFFVLCSALLAKHFGILSEAISFRKINIVPTNKHEGDRKCKIPIKSAGLRGALQLQKTEKSA